MPMQFDRRTMLAGTAMLLAAGAVPVKAQGHPKLRFSSVISEQDIRAGAMKMFAADLKADFDVELYFGATLFKQGTELVAMERGNLELANVAPQDIAKQVPEWSILTAAYLFRDPAHMKKVFQSDVGQEMSKLAEDRAGIHILAPVYYGTRQVNLRPEKHIATPADMAGIKLRMPDGEAWQFLGKSLGANPTPMAFTEVYTALQTGAIDGQDNPLPADKVMKFYEVTKQIVLTGHLVAFDMLSISSKAWKAMTPKQQQAVQAAATKAIDSSTAKHIEQEKELADFFKSQGLKVYAPDVKAFRDYAQKQYLSSTLSKDWPKGMLDRINAL